MILLGSNLSDTRAQDLTDRPFLPVGGGYRDGQYPAFHPQIATLGLGISWSGGL